LLKGPRENPSLKLRDGSADRRHARTFQWLSAYFVDCATGKNSSASNVGRFAMPINPKYYERMSELLDALIAQRKQQAGDYEKYLAGIVELAKKVKNPAWGTSYPASIDTAPKQALYDNLDKNEALASTIDAEIRKTKKDDWRGNKVKEKEVRNAIRRHLADEGQVDLIFDLVKNQLEY